MQSEIESLCDVVRYADWLRDELMANDPSASPVEPLVGLKESIERSSHKEKQFASWIGDESAADLSLALSRLKELFAVWIAGLDRANEPTVRNGINRSLRRAGWGLIASEARNGIDRAVSQLRSVSLGKELQVEGERWTRSQAAKHHRVHHNTIERARKRGEIEGDGTTYDAKSVKAWRPKKAENIDPEDNGAETTEDVESLVASVELETRQKQRAREWRCRCGRYQFGIHRPTTCVCKHADFC